MSSLLFWAKRLVLFVLFACICGFFVANKQTITLNLIPSSMVIELPFYVVALSVFLIGLGFGWFVMMISKFSLKTQLKRKEKKISALEDEIKQLKTAKSTTSALLKSS